MALQAVFENIRKENSSSIGLDGDTGHFLLACILFLKGYRFINQETLIELNNTLLDKIASQLDNLPLNYIDGLAGIVAVYHYLQQKDSLSFLTYPDFEDADSILFDQYIDMASQNAWDNMYGAGGMLASCLFNSDSVYLPKMLSHLRNYIMGGKNNGLLVNPIFGNSIADFGIAHGYAGLGNILMNIYENGLFRSDIEIIVQHFLHMYSLQPLNYACPETNIFPTQYDSTMDKYKHDKIQGWCYGDMGVALFISRCLATFRTSVYFPSLVTGISAVFSKQFQAPTGSNIFLCHGKSSFPILRQRFVTLSATWEELRLFQTGPISIPQLPIIDSIDDHTALSLENPSLLDGGIGVCLAQSTYESNQHNDYLKLLFL